MRQLRLWVLLLMTVSLLTACNLGAQSEEVLPTEETEEPVITGKPTVTIVSPDAGGEFFVDEQILVSVNASDSIGVTRVQLLANGSIVKTVSSESLAGQQSLQAVLDYTPRTGGQLELTVIAYRGTVASDPASITIEVNDEGDIVPTTSGGFNNQGGAFPGGGTGGTGGITIPNDGVCRALTNVGLNFRSQPYIANNVLFTLQAGTLAPIVGRLGNNTWWQLVVNGQTGWVSAAYTTEYGNCSFVPVINVNPPTNTPAPATATPTPTPTATTPVVVATATTVPQGKPNLLITSITVVGDEPVIIPGGETEVEAEISVTITNAGFGPAGSFRAVVIIDEAEYDLGVISSLGRGESIAVQTEVIFDETGDIPVRVIVDVDDDVDELSNVDNQGQVTIEVAAEL